jgi:3-dehydroquinate synthase
MRKNLLGYRVEIVQDSFGESGVLAEVLKENLGENGKVLLVADSNVVSHTAELGPKIGRYMNEHELAIAGKAVVIPGGEKVKHENLDAAFSILDAIVRRGLGQNDCVLALGGGVVFDLVGWAAAQLGNIKVVRMPTTPAAMTGAAFSTCSSIDRCGRKDIISLPSMPAAVVIDVAFIETVMEGVWRAGTGETACLSILDKSVCKVFCEEAPRYAAREYDAFGRMVEAVVEYRKKNKVEPIAEKLAARLEEQSDFRLPHGYAIPLSLMIEAGVLVEKGSLKEKTFVAVRDALEVCGSLGGLYHSRHILRRREVLFGDWPDAELYNRSVDVLVEYASARYNAQATDRAQGVCEQD